VLPELIESLGLTDPWTYLSVFLVASLLMLWRLEAMLDHGLEGTALGTLLTPYCSGLGNLLFVLILVQRGGAPGEVFTNCLVNNVTNLTVLLGVPALLWGLPVIGGAGAGGKGRAKGKPAAGGGGTGAQVNRLSLLLTLLAGLFFTGATWLLAGKGRLDRTDGLLLIGLFLFWQSFQVYDVMKHNLMRKTSFGLLFYLDAAVVLASAWLLYGSIDWLVAWISAQKTGFVSAAHLGWLSGLLMVMPNGLLAFYWGWKRRPDIVYTSQVGDGHICIPLCLGLYALLLPSAVPAGFATGLLLLLGASVLHGFCLLAFGGLPRWAGAVLTVAYAWFLWDGLLA
jgi:cation:H+ antiporter